MRCKEVGRIELAQEMSPVLGFVNLVMQLTQKLEFLEQLSNCEYFKKYCLPSSTE